MKCWLSPRCPSCTTLRRPWAHAWRATPRHLGGSRRRRRRRHVRRQHRG